MHVIDSYAQQCAEAATEEARAIAAAGTSRQEGHQAAARHAAERAASVRVEVDQIVRGLLGLPQT